MKKQTIDPANPSLTTIRIYNEPMQALARVSKDWPEGFPVMYANITQAKAMKAKMPTPEDWKIVKGSRPFYLVKIDWEKSFAGTVPEFQAEIHNIAFAGGLPYLEVYKRWRQYADAQYDQSALLSEFKENHALTLGLKKKVVIKDDKGNSETFTVTRQESEGFEAYLQKHITIPALALARLYFHYTKQGLDLMKLPLPADIARLAKPANILPFVTA